MKPSKIKVVKAKKAWLLLSNTRAITLFGTIFCKKQKDVDLINATDKVDSDLKCHETIHVRQAENTKDSWFIYYCKYIWQWIMNFPLILVDINAPYKFIPFELEAYRHEEEFDYCNKACDGWKKYNTLKLKEKRMFAKEYYGGHYIFRDFIREKIDPYLA